VLVAAEPPQEVRPSRVRTKAKGKRSFTAHLSSFSEMTSAYGSDSTLSLKLQNGFIKTGYRATRRRQTLYPCPGDKTASG
jgi:hypothetical protein